MKNYDVIVGIDVGLNGGLAFFDAHSGEVLSLYPMPTIQVEKNGKDKKVVDWDRLKFILEIPKEHKENAILAFENVTAFPGQGVVAVGTLLEQKGFFRGLSRGLGYAEYLVQPKTWQKHFDIVPPKELKGESAKKTKALRKKWLKESSLEIAKRKFPEWETKLSRKDAHGLSDALLIGEWYLRTNPDEYPLENLGNG